MIILRIQVNLLSYYRILGDAIAAGAEARPKTPRASLQTDSVRSLQSRFLLMTFLGEFAVPAGEGKLKKMSIRTSSIYIAPATEALPKLSLG
jgi:hypothetical protein